MLSVNMTLSMDGRGRAGPGRGKSVMYQNSHWAKFPLGKTLIGQNSLWAKLQLSTEQLVVDLLLDFRSDDLVDEEDSVLIVLAVGSSCASP